VIRVTWAQPEDLVPHELVASADEGKDIDSLAARWSAAGGSLIAPVAGSTPEPASPALRTLARDLLAELDTLPVPGALADREPDDLAAIEQLWPPQTAVDAPATPRGAGQLDVLAGRVHGAWLGRAAGCLLGKPVEKVPRHGIRAILESTGDWPLTRYFTAEGLDPAVAAEFPWNRRSATTSLRENIAGMPEDDDLNYPLIALGLLEDAGSGFTTDDVARAWLAKLPGGRVFTAERIAYRNLLDGYEPDIAGAVRNPFREWIGAQIRTDVYGWTRPGDPRAAARLAWTDSRLSHSRSGRYGAMFVAAACAAAVVAGDVATVLDAAIAVVPPDSRYADAIRRGRELAASPLDDESALDELYREFGRYHWVHALNNSVLAAFALARGDGDFVRSITLAVMGGWDTDSVGATVGSICGALSGAAALPPEWVAPLRNRLATSIPGLDGVGFDELAARTVSLVAAGAAG
jgi:ADP-ribosylglycohydrolase